MSSNSRNMYINSLLLLEYLEQIDAEEENLQNSIAFAKNFATRQVESYTITRSSNNSVESFDPSSVDTKKMLQASLSQLRFIQELLDEQSKWIVQPLIDYTRKRIAMNFRESLESEKKR